MTPLRILLLTPALPFPPTQGASLRNYNILRGLAADHAVTLLSFVDQTTSSADLGAETPLAAETDALSHLNSLCEAVRTVPIPQRQKRERLKNMLLSPWPDMGHRLESTAFNSALHKLLQQPFDIVQIEGIELGRALPLIRARQPAAKIIFDNHNAEADLQWRTFLTDIRRPGKWPLAAYSLIQVGKLRPFERQICQAADGVVAVSQADVVKLEKLAGPLDHPVKVIPNTIDIHDYRTEKRPDDPRFDLVFTGKMDYRPNVDAVTWFLSAIWPLIQQQKPQTTFALVGQKPHPLVASAAAAAGPAVTLTGFVPEIAPYLTGANVVIMPLRMGSGTRLKLLEALASQKAVVTTAAGAEGIAAGSSPPFVIADRPSEFAAAVVRLLDDPAARDALSRNAREVAGRYDWRVVVPQFLDFYREVGVGRVENNG